MKTLFLHPPSFDGFDRRGARYQMKRGCALSLVSNRLAQPASLRVSWCTPPHRLSSRHRPGSTAAHWWYHTSTPRSQRM
jgi:hypothetical protein